MTNNYLTNSICVFIGGGVGATIRYLVSVIWRLVATRVGVDAICFPWPTLFVNLMGCLLIGYFYWLGNNWGLSSDMKLLLITGFCGGLTTFSTFSYEVVGLCQAGHPFQALIYVFASVVMGIICVCIPLCKFVL